MFPHAVVLPFDHFSAESAPMGTPSPNFNANQIAAIESHATTNNAHAAIDESINVVIAIDRVESHPQRLTKPPVRHVDAAANAEA